MRGMPRSLDRKRASRDVERPDRFRIDPLDWTGGVVCNCLMACPTQRADTLVRGVLSLLARLFGPGWDQSLRLVISLVIDIVNAIQRSYSMDALAKSSIAEAIVRSGCSGKDHDISK